jgi:membrane protease YdiL (CAAX protease family)
MVLCGAFLEEVFFRGYVFRKLLEKFPPFVSLTLSSFIFVGLHCINPGITFLSVLNIFLAGLLLGLLFLKTGNIWLAVGFHLFWNYIQSILGFDVSGMGLPSVISLNFEYANSFNGGYFGFEGSYVCSIILLLLTLYSFCKKINK